MREMPRSAQRGEHQRTDPDYAPRVETFDNLSHRELHAAVNLLDPAALNAGGRVWSGAAAGLATAVEAAGAEVRAAMADGWRGPAAATAAAAVAAFEQRGRELADVIGVVGERLNRAGDAAETVRAGVGAPTAGEPDLAAALLDPGSAAANVAAQKAAETARLDVVRVMEDVYAGAFLPTGNGIPAFPDTDVPAGAAAAPGAETGAGARSGTGGESGATPVATPVALAVGGTESERATEEPAVREESAEAEAGTPDPTAPADAASTTGPAATHAAATAPAGTVAAALAATPHLTAPHLATPHLTGGGTAPVSATVPGVIPPTVPADDRKKQQEEERRTKPRESTGAEAVTGLGAGAMGGLLGGALAASETTRPGHGVGAHLPPRPPADDPDDDLHFADEDLTYLEPADDNGTLIGALEPTTPPVLGEWSERE